MESSLLHLFCPNGDWVEESVTPTVECIVLILSLAAGLLIGKQGHTLSRIADSSVGVEVINISRLASDGMQEIQLVGREIGVQKAKSELICPIVFWCNGHGYC